MLEVRQHWQRVFNHLTQSVKTGTKWQIAGGVMALLICTIVPALLFGQAIAGEKYKKEVVKDILYGQGKESVGKLSVEDLPRRGPESFSNDTEGNFYISDTVNRRIQIFSSDGAHLYEIPLQEGMVASDVAVDKLGRIYVYDAQGKLYQYDKEGNLLSSINVDTGRWQIRMDMHIADDRIYITSVEQEDVLIGRIVNGLLVTPTADDLSKPLPKGVYGFSGKRYFVHLTRWEKGNVEIIDASGVTFRTIDIPIKGLVSIKFLQDDKNGKFYLQTERTENDKVILEVQKFAADGSHLTTLGIPDTDYDTWSVRLLSIDENGNIYQFLPSKEKGRLNTFRQEQ